MAPTTAHQTPSVLHELAELHGVATQFQGFDGDRRTVADDTLRAVLTALDVDVSSAQAERASLEHARTHTWQRVVPEIVVAERGETTDVELTVPEDANVRVHWAPEGHGGSGQELSPAASTARKTVVGTRYERRTVRLPEDAELGWYELRVSVSPGDTHVVPVAITPARLTTTDRLRGARRWGYMAQLYSVMSSRSWGVGDLADLASLAAVSGRQGADYMLINPLHAAEPVPPIEDSPYLPSSRRFFNPLYVRIPDVPEFSYLRPADRDAVSQLAAVQRKTVLDASDIDRDAAYRAKLTSLELLFTVRRSPHRQQQLEAFVAAGGQPLQDFALWCALREELGPDAPQWRDEAATPTSPYAEAARERLARRIDFHVWLQWLLDDQLEAAQRAAHRAGMDVGVVHDLAVGVSRTGADAWALQDVLASGVSVGAPADMYNQLGQDWSQPPWHPRRLAAAGYAPWRDMLRTIFRHAGGIRIDHVAGLFRLWWIPDGHEASDGAYVSYDHRAMVGILALEAELAGVVVVGEDLGTVEPWVREYLEDHGVLGTSILWFETDDDGAPLDPARYRQLCMASVNTHDLPPTPGYLQGVQLELRERLDLLARSPEVERAAARDQLDAFFAAVRAVGIALPENAGVAERVEALYRFLGRAPSVLFNVSLVDAVGETRIQNQPGTSHEYPNWRIPLADEEQRPVLIEHLASNERVNSLVAVVNEALGTRARKPVTGAPEQPCTPDPADPFPEGVSSPRTLG